MGVISSKRELLEATRYAEQPPFKKIEHQQPAKLISWRLTRTIVVISTEMTSVINYSNFLAMVEQFTAEQKAEFLALLQPAKKTKAAPPAPVLADGWAVAEPAKKGPHAGKARWFHAENEEHVYEFPSAAPAPPKKAAAKPKKEAKAPSPAPAASASDERLMGRMSKEDVKALSKEERKRRAELKKAASEERKANRSPEEQAKIDARVAAMKAGRAKSKASAGGSPSAEEAEESGSAEE